MAISQLQALSGAALLPSPFSVLRLTALAQHCTHLVDMAALAIAAAARGVRYRQYDAIIGLADGDGADWRIGTLARDDGGTCRWVVRDGLVCEPSNYAGLEMRRAASWISSRTDDVDAIEETFVMQRAMLVAGGGRFVLDDHPKPSAHVWMVGACFAFQPSRIEQGRRQFGSTRSFTHPDELLVDLASQQTRP
jgi:hypothetical protein